MTTPIKPVPKLQVERMTIHYPNKPEVPPKEVPVPPQTGKLDAIRREQIEWKEKRGRS